MIPRVLRRRPALLALTARGAGVACLVTLVAGLAQAGVSPSLSANLSQKAIAETTATAAPSHVLPLSEARPVPQSWPQPVPVAGARSDHGAMQSTNWSGYVASGTGAKFSEASGSWTVPEVRPGPAGYSSSWVGIDGTSTEDLIQAGTEQDWGPQGVVYYAWYELLPASSMYLGPVYPGDKINVAISKTGTATWTVDVYDLTQHRVWAGAVSYTVPGDSAEWVEEAPTNGQTFSLYPLADFGSVEFSALTVGGPGTDKATISPVYMVSSHSGKIEAYPRQYDAGSDSFDVAFGALSSNFTGWPAAPLGKPNSPNSPNSVVTGGTTGTSGTVGAAKTTATGTAATTGTTTPAPASGPSTLGKPGYWLVGGDGGVFSFGSAHYGGSTAKVFGRAKLPGVTGVAAAPGGGYWLVTATGGVFPLGGAAYLGSVASLNLSAGATPSIAAAPTGAGYYILSPWGDVFAFGEARYEGSCTRAKCGPSDAVALVPDATGGGYWLLLANCKVVAFGDAPALSSPACEQASRGTDPVRAAGRAPDGGGFWALLGNRAVYALGTAADYGHWALSPTSPAAPALAQGSDPPSAEPSGRGPQAPADRPTAVAIVPTRDGYGAWVVRSDGSVETLGDASPLGALPQGADLNQPIISATSS